MADPEVVILIGSANDWKHLQGAVDVLRKLGITFEVHVSSAHRTPVRTAELVQSAEAAGCRAFICAAGMAAHLAGVVSTVQMPAGIPVATFAVGSAGARNAAIFAAQIVADNRPEIRASLKALRTEGEAKVLAGDRQVAAAVSEEDAQ